MKNITCFWHRQYRSRPSLVPILVMLAILVGCGGGSIYQPKSFATAGYTDEKIEENVFFVTYAGIIGSDQLTRDLALLRSAEVAIENGYPYFLIKPSEFSEEKLKSQLDLQTTVDVRGPHSLTAKRIVVGYKSKENGVELIDAEIARRKIRERYKLSD